MVDCSNFWKGLLGGVKSHSILKLAEQRKEVRVPAARQQPTRCMFTFASNFTRLCILPPDRPRAASCSSSCHHNCLHPGLCPLPSANHRQHSTMGATEDTRPLPDGWVKVLDVLPSYSLHSLTMFISNGIATTIDGSTSIQSIPMDLGRYGFIRVSCRRL